MARYFTFAELVYSATALSKGIDNTPTSTEVKNNLLELIDILDVIREEWTEKCEKNNWGTGSIIVTSGYRCNALNKAVGGSKNSSHMLGTAVDLKPKNGRNMEFFEFIKEYLSDKNFDELINEKPVRGIPSWVHLGLRSSEGKQRRKVFTIK